jgi:hypothetical protein
MDPVDRVRGILARLPAAIRTLSIRRTGRPPLTIDDEYDLQYLLHALLVVDFRDVRPEEWTPSYAGSASRMDFLLKPERVVVETKFVREDHDDRKITNELLIDRERYRAHQDCQTLVCYVYDPFRRLRNPEAIQNDLRSESNPKTVVVVYPV